MVYLAVRLPTAAPKTLPALAPAIKCVPVEASVWHATARRGQREREREREREKKAEKENVCTLYMGNSNGGGCSVAIAISTFRHYVLGRSVGTASTLSLFQSSLFVCLHCCYCHCSVQIHDHHNHHHHDDNPRRSSRVVCCWCCGVGDGRSEKVHQRVQTLVKERGALAATSRAVELHRIKICCDFILFFQSASVHQQKLNFFPTVH